MGKTNDHAANQRLVVTCMVAENCHQKIVIMKIFLFKFFLYFLKKKIISAWPRTAIGKKFHIGMAENCHCILHQRSARRIHLCQLMNPKSLGVLL